MEQTLEKFKNQQAQTLSIMERLQEFIIEGESYGVAIDEPVKKKLCDAMRDLANEKMRVVLIGGFSEGKTAIAAAWIERLDKSTMHISHEESSNAIVQYEAGNDCILIDTPGLFGFKERFDEETGKIEKYKDLTQRYISQAHLVLYVMDPANPIKASHREDLNWVFRKLGLLPRTVFVLNRFDEVSDLEDEQDYAHNFLIKKKNVTQQLETLISLSAQEAENLSVVAVAADPFGKGSEYWLNNMEEFRSLSRINTLQHATAEKIKQSGEAHEIIDVTRRSIVRDVLSTKLPIAIQYFEKVDQEVSRLKSAENQLSEEISVLNKQVSDIKIILRDFVARFFADLILQVKGTSIESFVDFFERNIGSEGVMINTTLQNEFAKHLGSVQLSLDKIVVSFDSEVQHFNAIMQTLSTLGIKHLSSSQLIEPGTIIWTRDALVGAAKFVGLDIAKHLKFKPWGAVNLAKGMNGIFVALGLAMELWDTLEQASREKKFRETQETMVNNFEGQRKELLELVESDSFIDNSLPDLKNLQTAMAAIQKDLEGREEIRKKFYQWCKKGEKINADFKEKT